MAEAQSSAIFVNDSPGRMPAARIRNVRWTRGMKRLSEASDAQPPLPPSPDTVIFETDAEKKERLSEIADYFN